MQEPRLIGDLMRELGDKPVKVNGTANIMALYKNHKQQHRNESNTDIGKRGKGHCSF